MASSTVPNSRTTEYRGKTRGVNKSFYVWRRSLVFAVGVALGLCVLGMLYLLLFTHPSWGGNLAAFYALCRFRQLLWTLAGWLYAPAAGGAIPRSSSGLLAVHAAGPSGVCRDHDQPVFSSDGQAGGARSPVDSSGHRRCGGRADVARDEEE